MSIVVPVPRQQGNGMISCSARAGVNDFQRSTPLSAAGGRCGKLESWSVGIVICPSAVPNDTYSEQSFRQELNALKSLRQTATEDEDLDWVHCPCFVCLYVFVTQQPSESEVR